MSRAASRPRRDEPWVAEAAYSLGRWVELSAALFFTGPALRLAPLPIGFSFRRRNDAEITFYYELSL